MRNFTPPSTAGRHTAIKFNQGQALLHLAGMYPTLHEVILELVQNALDKDVRATRIWIVVNQKTRHIAVRDNGAGTTLDRFNEALASVAEPGRKGEGSLGQFGIGLISPLGKCKEFVFLSCPAPHMYGFQEWTFRTDHITAQRQDLMIPLRARDDLTLQDRPPPGKTRLQWRSEMSLTGITTDGVVGQISMDALIGGIQDRYATVMRRNKTIISVEITDKDGSVERRPNVTASDFRGRALEEWTYVEPSAGRTTFRLFVAPKSKTGRSGRVVVGIMGNDFRIPLHYVVRSATALLGEEVVTALSSGLFEGEIISECAKLHPSRRSLVKDDAFIGFCLAIEEWYNQVGSKCVDEIRQSRQEQRFQDLGLRSMKVIEGLLNNPALSSLRAVIGSFGRGTVSSAHHDPTKKVVGEQEKPALSVQGVFATPSGEDPEDPDDGGGSSAEKPPRPPLTVTGPRGPRRKIVRSSSFGLQFAHEPVEGSPDLWNLDTREGVLTFNIRHPLWVACDVRDVPLMKLQEWVAIQALTLEMMPPALRVPQRLILDEITVSMVSWILGADKARGSIPNPKGKRRPSQ